MVGESALNSLAFKQPCMRSSVERRQGGGNKSAGASEMRPVNCTSAVLQRSLKEQWRGLITSNITALGLSRQNSDGY